MSLKHLRENYARLLNTFKEAGVQLTESQKSDIDSFMLALEGSINQTKIATMKATQKVVEKKLSKEFQQVFESILKHKAEHDELAGKIESRVNRINESKKISREVDNYLETVLNESLPKQTIVDSLRLKKLESVFESLKDTLLINDESVEAKRKELTESFESEKSDLIKKIAVLEKKLNNAIAHERKLTAVLESKKAQDLLNKKTRDLPLFEAQQIKKRFANASCEEIEKNFKKLLESVREEMKEVCGEEEKTLEEEISSIIANECGDVDGKTASAKIDSSKKKEVPVEEADEEIADNEVEEESEDDDDVKLDESEMIPSGLMKLWINRSSTINPIG